MYRPVRASLLWRLLCIKRTIGLLLWPSLQPIRGKEEGWHAVEGGLLWSWLFLFHLACFRDNRHRLSL